MILNLATENFKHSHLLLHWECWFSCLAHCRRLRLLCCRTSSLELIILFYINSNDIKVSYLYDLLGLELNCSGFQDARNCGCEGLWLYSQNIIALHVIRTRLMRMKVKVKVKLYMTECCQALGDGCFGQLRKF